MVRANGTESIAIISNISQAGFRLHVAETPDIGEFVFLRGKSGDVPAQIRWSLGSDAGGVFLQPKDDG